MSNIRGEQQPYGQLTGKSRVIKNHAYGQDLDIQRVSSHVTTENFNSKNVLNSVNEYCDNIPKPTMFDPLP